MAGMPVSNTGLLAHLVLNMKLAALISYKNIGLQASYSVRGVSMIWSFGPIHKRPAKSVIKM
jgi:hypothetical protein